MHAFSEDGNKITSGSTMARGLYPIYLHSSETLLLMALIKHFGKENQEDKRSFMGRNLHNPISSISSGIIAVISTGG